MFFSSLILCVCSNLLFLIDDWLFLSLVIYRGVYIASLFYSDDSKLLITTDDQVPIIEVADATGTAIGQDFVWLANLACTWEHVQAMCDITDSCTSSPGLLFRNLLLHAVLDMQNALGVTDLGLLHPVPYKDSQGAIVFVIVQYTSDVSKSLPLYEISYSFITKLSSIRKINKTH